MSIDLDASSTNTQFFGVPKSEERNNNFRILGKMGVNSLRNKHTIKQKNLESIEKNVLYFQYNKSFFDTCKDEPRFISHMQALTTPPKNYDENNARQQQNFFGACRNNSNIGMMLILLRFIFETGREIADELYEYVETADCERGLFMPKEYFHATIAAKAVNMINSINLMEWLSLFKTARVIPQTKDQTKQGMALVMLEEHPEYKLSRHYLLHLSLWWNQSALAKEMRETANKRTEKQEKNMNPHKLGIFEDMKIRNHSPMGDVVKVEGARLREFLFTAKNYLKEKNLLDENKFYTEKEYLDLYETHSGIKYTPYTEQMIE